MKRPFGLLFSLECFIRKTICVIHWENIANVLDPIKLIMVNLICHKLFLGDFQFLTHIYTYIFVIFFFILQISLIFIKIREE